MVHKEQARSWIRSLICYQISFWNAHFNSCFNLGGKMSISRCVLNFKHTSTAAKLNIGHQKPTKAVCCRSFILWSSKGEQKEQEQTSPLLPDDSLESRDGQEPGQSFFCCYSGYINRIYDAVRLLLDHPAANREGKRGDLSECSGQIQHDKGKTAKCYRRIEDQPV